MYTLYPAKSMVNLIGNDGSGTHQSSSNSFAAIMHVGEIDFTKAPAEVNLSTEGYMGFKLFFTSLHTFKYKIYRIISTVIGRRFCPSIFG
jgi:hypothetical protein